MENSDNRTVREPLAVDRTHLANERTLLAYIRTSLATIALGTFILHLKISEYSLVLGVTAMAIAVILLVAGIIRYYYYYKRINLEKYIIEQERHIGYLVQQQAIKT